MTDKSFYTGHEKSQVRIGTLKGVSSYQRDLREKEENERCSESDAGQYFCY